MIRAADAVAHVRRLGIPGYGDDEVAFIAKTLLKLQPSHVFEWGTNVGASARIFHEVTRLAGIRSTVHTWEHPDMTTRDHPGHRHAELVDGIATVIPYIGEGLIGALSLYTSTTPARALFFLDGDHSYATVLKELRAIAKVAAEAVILVHDLRHPTERTGDAVHDFAAEQNGRYVLAELASQAGMGRLWPRA